MGRAGESHPRRPRRDLPSLSDTQMGFPVQARRWTAVVSTYLASKRFMCPVRANLVEGDKVTVHDPDPRLPHDQSSWP